MHRIPAHPPRIGPSASPATALALLLAGCVAALAGCATADQSFVEPFSAGNERLDLNAEDVVHAMRRAGFNDEQILEHGPELRNALAAEGGARLRARAFTEALFIAENGALYGASRQRGSFRYTPASTLQAEPEQPPEPEPEPDAPPDSAAESATEPESGADFDIPGP